jgi:hypothetical protein
MNFYAAWLGAATLTTISVEESYSDYLNADRVRLILE